MKAARFESAGLRFPIARGFVIPVFILSLAIPHLTRTNGTLLGALLSSLVACGLGWPSTSPTSAGSSAGR